MTWMAAALSLPSEILSDDLLSLVEEAVPTSKGVQMVSQAVGDEWRLGEVSEYAGGDYVAVRGNVVDVCSSHDGWPLVRGTAIERREDPYAG